MSENTTENDLTQTETARANILRRMLKRRAADNKQLREEELSQVVPSDQRHKAREMLQDLLRDPNAPVLSPGGGARDVYILESLDAGAKALKELTGEEFDYRGKTHDLSEPETETEITLELTWEHANTVEHTLTNTDADVTFKMDYESHPPNVSIRGMEEPIQSIREELRDATSGDVTW